MGIFDSCYLLCLRCIFYRTSGGTFLTLPPFLYLQYNCTLFSPCIRLTTFSALNFQLLSLRNPLCSSIVLFMILSFIFKLEVFVIVFLSHFLPPKHSSLLFLFQLFISYIIIQSSFGLISKFNNLFELYLDSILVKQIGLQFYLWVTISIQVYYVLISQLLTSNLTNICLAKVGFCFENFIKRVLKVTLPFS